MWTVVLQEETIILAHSHSFRKASHLENPEFRELVFAYVEVPEIKARIAA